MPANDAIVDLTRVPERSAQLNLIETYGESTPPLHAWTYPALEEVPTAPVMIGAHGFRGDHHGFEQFVLHSDPSWTWIVPDFPGFGSAPRMPEETRHDADGFAQVLLRVIEYARATYPRRPLILVGHSFGSVIAAQSIAQKADAVDALVLVNPISVPALETSSRLAAAAATLYYECAKALPKPLGLGLVRSRMITDVMTVLMSTATEKRTRAYTNEQHRAYFAGFQDTAVLMRAYSSSIHASVREQAPAITVPTLLISGEKDAFGSPQTQRALSAAIETSRLVELSGVGHLIPYEAPGRTVEEIASFLEELPFSLSKATAS